MPSGSKIRLRRKSSIDMARDLLDEDGHVVGRVAVLPAIARLEMQRERRRALDHLGRGSTGVRLAVAVPRPPAIPRLRAAGFSGVRPSPEVCVRTWRTVTGRAGFTSCPFSSTILFAYDGSHFEIGSSSMNLPSSQSIISAVETIGLVIDISVKIVSFCIGWFSSL